MPIAHDQPDPNRTPAVRTTASGRVRRSAVRALRHAALRAAMALLLAAPVTLTALATADHRALAEGNAAQGAHVFTRCSACHQVGAGAAHGRGPQLNGVIGRPIASIPGYRYSEGLAQRRGETWTPDLLRTYVGDPARFVGGRSPMPAQRLRPNQLDDLIAFLASQGG